jgi:stearoyl-CoA 9-desaturase NADPH oxidoreductase
LTSTVRGSASALGARRLAGRLAGSGLLQALAAPHGVERYLELLTPGLSIAELRAEIVSVRHPAPRTVTLRLRPNELWRGFRAGQFVALTVEIDGIRRTRCYSPASSPHASDGEIELTVRSHEHGLVSRYLMRRAGPGMMVGLAQADGDFVLPHPRPERTLLISGGSGITPVMSMLRTLCDEGHRAPVTFLHYSRTERECPYRAELNELASRYPNVRVELVVTRAARRPEHLTRARLSAVDPAYRDADVYVCGPTGLIAAARALYEHDGHGDRVHAESFLPRRVPAPPEGVAGSVRFAASGVEVATTGATLLEHAERAGLSPPYGCRMGICHTCTSRKLSGQVRDLNSGELSPCEEQEIQLCVSVPAGDVELNL